MRTRKERIEEELRELRTNLQCRHSVFHALWSAGDLVVDDSTSVQTAGVFFSDDGSALQFVFNPDYWDSLTPPQKEFVVCHEALHVLMSHGERFRGKFKHPQANKALDIAVNSALINDFGLGASAVGRDFLSDLETLDKMPDEEDRVPNMSAEWYFKRLTKDEDPEETAEKCSGPGFPPGAPGSGGSHEYLEDLVKTQEDSEVLENIVEEALDEVRVEDIEDFMDKPSINADKPSSGRGTLSGNGSRRLRVKKGNSKKEWKTMITESFGLGFEDEPKMQWATTPRRYSDVLARQNIILPSEEDVPEQDDRIELWFFQDTSGSCESFFQRFFDAAMTIPQSRFKIKFHCFDTQVYPIDLDNPKAQGFGGTSFTCIENYIQDTINREKIPYPQAVYVMTDGHGNEVRPERPERWSWFMTDYYSDWCIPSESKIEKLSEYEIVSK